MRFSPVGRALFLGSQIGAIVLALAVTTCVFWRTWDENRERQAMETAFKEMTFPNPGPLKKRLGKSDYQFNFPLGPGLSTRPQEADDARDVEISLDVYCRKYHWYCLVSHVRYVDMGSGRGAGLGFVGFDIYRLQKPAASYKARIERGELQPAPLSFKGDPSHWRYVADFADVCAVERQTT